MEVATNPSPDVTGVVAPLSGNSVGLQRARVTHSIREVFVIHTLQRVSDVTFRLDDHVSILFQITLCKDENCKVGLKVRTFDTGVFICLVTKGSPAALCGVRFGDQILSINNELVAGYTADQVHGIFKNATFNDIKVVIKDRSVFVFV